MKIISIILVIVVVVFISRLVIQNITTPTYLGHNQGLLAEMPSKPNAVSSQTTATDKFVSPLPYNGSTHETHAAVIAALKSMANNEIKVNESNYLYTVFTTKVLRFHDDVEILLDEQNKQVHFRSQSRAGHSDLGVNRERYEAFKQYYLSLLNNN